MIEGLLNDRKQAFFQLIEAIGGLHWSIRGGPSLVLVLGKLMRLDDGIKVHGTKQMREGIFGLIDLLELQLRLQLADFDFQQEKSRFAGIPALSGLGVLRGCAQVDKSFLDTVQEEVSEGKRRESRQKILPRTDAKLGGVYTPADCAWS